MKKAFLVIVDYPDDITIHEPHIGDIHWSLPFTQWADVCGWQVHTTEATAEMLARHGVPYPSENVECPTCGGSGEVAHTVALPGHALATTVTRYDPCPDCTPENVEEPT